MCVQIEGSILRQSQLDASRASVHNPFSGGFAFNLDAAAARLGLQRAMQVVNIKSAGTSHCPDGTGSSLFEGQMAASSFAVKTSSDIQSMDRAAAGAGVN